MSASVPQLPVLFVGLLVAVVFDVRYRRVPNVICGIILAVGLLARGVLQGPLSALAGFGGAALVLFALFRPWQRGGIGGGDVKLAAATAAWLEWSQLIWFVLASALAGGIVAAICYFLSRASTRAEVRASLTLAVLHQELPAAPSHRRGHPSVPYALAIAAGAAFVFLYKG